MGIVSTAIALVAAVHIFNTEKEVDFAAEVVRKELTT
jgi:hypothetical protein